MNRLRGCAGRSSSGTLRVAAPIDHAMQFVAPALAEFAAMHTQVRLDLYSSDRTADLLAEGIDLGIRLGALRDSSLRVIKLGQFEQHVVAAPAYLRRVGEPSRPADLAEHAWIAFSLLRTPLTWAFTSAGQPDQTVRMKARMRVDSSASLRSLLEHGAGISVLDQCSIADAVAAGRLVRLLPKWNLPTGGIYAVRPPGKYVPANVRTFIDFYRTYLAEQLRSASSSGQATHASREEARGRSLK